MLKAIIFILILYSPILINAQTEKLPFIPIIKNDTAIFSGKIEGKKIDVQGSKAINLSFTSLLTGDLMNYDIPVNSDGTFQLKIPVECITLVYIESDYYNGLNYLIPGEESKLNIYFDNDQNNRVVFKNSIGFTSDDANTILNWPSEFPRIENEIITPEVFSQRMLNGMQEMLKSINCNEKLTPLAKQNIASGTKFFVVFNRLLKYNEFINKANLAPNKTDTSNVEFQPQEPGQSYYSFLKYINLNDPINLTTAFYPLIVKQIMGIKTLAIPDIGDQPVDLWLDKVKQIMKDKFGFENGIVYDIMACYSYLKQLSSLNPLSEIQKKNIQNYFSNKSFVEVLFAKNEKALRETGTKSKTNIYKISESSEQTMDSIIARYKGKVVFVDFWATWCSPCLKAIHESENVRKEFENKDVVFLFVADNSSPQNIWEQKIFEIKGEQYYLTQKAMSYVYKRYDFTTVPHYLIFDKSGTLKHNNGHLMGNENMRKWIQELL
jgi:thiol-disulfide isomerase/thioredoxin